MRISKRIVLTSAIVAIVAGGALAQSAVDGAIKARKAHMGLLAFNVGPLGAMAKGDMPYDAAMATTLATNLSHIASLDMTRYWTEGSAKGEAEGTRAQPAIWENMADVGVKAAALRDATTALAAAAGTDLAALQAAMGPVGQACGACHQTYRASE
jgi:cytochrome c556